MRKLKFKRGAKVTPTQAYIRWQIQNEAGLFGVRDVFSSKNKKITLIRLDSVDEIILWRLARQGVPIKGTILSMTSPIGDRDTPVYSVALSSPYGSIILFMEERHLKKA